MASPVAFGRGPNDTIGVGVIGVGGMGSAHCGSLMNINKNKQENLQIRAVCDVAKPRVDRRAKDCSNKQGIKVAAHRYYQDLIECDALDDHTIRMKYRKQYFKSFEFTAGMASYGPPFHVFREFFKADSKELTLESLTPEEETARDAEMRALEEQVRTNADAIRQFKYDMKDLENTISGGY